MKNSNTFKRFPRKLKKAMVQNGKYDLYKYVGILYNTKFQLGNKSRKLKVQHHESN